MKPRSNWIVINLTVAERSKAGLFLPSTAAVGEGVIVAVGPKAAKDLKQGQRVLFDKAKQQSAGNENPNLVMVRDDEVRGVLSEPAEPVSE